MPLIKKPEPIAAKQQMKVRLNQSLIKEIEDYCKWAELPSQDYFIEQVALMALEKDKKWINHRNSKIE
ncbi:hypothetical protein BH10PSE19_BH10PSE19_10020 [soil metagenome]